MGFAGAQQKKCEALFGTTIHKNNKNEKEHTKNSKNTNIQKYRNTKAQKEIAKSSTRKKFKLLYADVIKDT